MKFREHRGGLAESMATVVELKDKAALIEHCKKVMEAYMLPAQAIADLTVEPYGGIDTRIGWDTHIVTIGCYGVLGFTDGPCE